MEKDFYLNIGRASEIADKKDRRFYRMLEIFPGFLSWLTLFLIILFSWLFPFWIAIFIIAFDVYWFFKTVFLSLHMRSAFNKMKVNLKRNWLEELDKVNVSSEVLAEVKWQDIYHLIILPMYKESLEVARSTFLSLTKVNYPLDKLITVLAVEERGGEAASNIAEEMEREFGNKFFKFLITKHPANIAGEIAGKGSNDAWAIKEAKSKIIDELKIPYERVIVSCFDVDTIILPGFYGCLTYNFL